MAEINIADIKTALGVVTVPYLETDLISAGCPCDVDLVANSAKIKVTLGFPAGAVAAQLADDLRRAVLQETQLGSADVEVDWEVRSHTVQGSLTPLPNVKNIIAVASGKGGVGKSTTAVNLALALSLEGSRAGILDADIYGPSQPRMLGLTNQNPLSRDGKTFEPLEAHGIQAISIGFLVDEDQAMIWRGPMVTQAVNQLVFQTNWRDLDYLIVDLPPGTGDTQLTLTQRVPLSGAIVVTTPQEISLLDARRGLKMFQKVNVTVLGVVENMSTYICPGCGHQESIFGDGGGRRLADESDIPLLAQLPLDSRIRREADGGKPTVISDPDSPIAEQYRDMARRVAARLSLSGKDRKAGFPKIVVEEKV